MDHEIREFLKKQIDKLQKEKTQAMPCIEVKVKQLFREDYRCVSCGRVLKTHKMNSGRKLVLVERCNCVKEDE